MHTYNGLNQWNYDVFIDVDKLELGDHWNLKIQENITNRDIFVVIITRGALKSSSVKDEVTLAQKMKKRIIPCLYKDIKFNHLKWNLDGRHGFHFRDEYGLIRELDAKLDRIESVDMREINNSVITSFSEIPLVPLKWKRIPSINQEAKTDAVNNKKIGLKDAKTDQNEIKYLAKLAAEKPRIIKEMVTENYNLLERTSNESKVNNKRNHEINIPVRIWKQVEMMYRKYYTAKELVDNFHTLGLNNEFNEQTHLIEFLGNLTQGDKLKVLKDVLSIPEFWLSAYDITEIENSKTKIQNFNNKNPFFPLFPGNIASFSSYSSYGIPSKPEQYNPPEHKGWARILIDMLSSCNIRYLPETKNFLVDGEEYKF